MPLSTIAARYRKDNHGADNSFLSTGDIITNPGEDVNYFKLQRQSIECYDRLLVVAGKLRNTNTGVMAQIRASEEEKANANRRSATHASVPHAGSEEMVASLTAIITNREVDSRAFKRGIRKERRLSFRSRKRTEWNKAAVP